MLERSGKSRGSATTAAERAARQHCPTLPFPGAERGEAVFSPCGRYRYDLHRRADRPGPKLLVIMANPSVATAIENDHTISKVEGFADRWGFGAVHICNLFAFVSTDPAGMYAAEDPVGPENDAHIIAAADRCDRVFVGWGEIGLYRNRDRAVMAMLIASGHRPFCIGITKTGAPKHPSRPGYAMDRVTYLGRGHG